MRHFHVATPLVSLCVLFTSSVTIAFAADSPASGAAPALSERIKGEWVIYRNTPSGRYMTIKDHRDDHTVVTTYDANKNPVACHRSDYDIDASGPAPVFRYRNKVVLLGPSAGAKDERESAYILRVEGDRFYEVHGMLPSDRGEPSLIIWERLKGKAAP